MSPATCQQGYFTSQYNSIRVGYMKITQKQGCGVNSRNLSLEGDSDSGPYLFQLDFV